MRAQSQVSRFPASASLSSRHETRKRRMRRCYVTKIFPSTSRISFLCDVLTRWRPSRLTRIYIQHSRDDGSSISGDFVRHCSWIRVEEKACPVSLDTGRVGRSMYSSVGGTPNIADFQVSQRLRSRRFQLSRPWRRVERGLPHLPINAGRGFYRPILPGGRDNV